MSTSLDGRLNNSFSVNYLNLQFFLPMKQRNQDPNNNKSIDIQVRFNEQTEAKSGDCHYAFEKFCAAVYALAIGEGKIKDRLITAYYEFAPVQSADLPQELRDEFEWIIKSLTKNPSKFTTRVDNGEIIQEPLGRLLSTVPYMRYSKAVEIAKRICELEEKVREYIEEIDGSHYHKP